jgi:uncharacterized small protein (DUF1192 family)
MMDAELMRLRAIVNDQAASIVQLSADNEKLQIESNERVLKLLEQIAALHAEVERLRAELEQK